MLRKFILLLGCFAASPAAAGEVRLSGEAIKTTFSGSVLALDTPIGSTISVRIGHDGLMAGEAGTALGTVLGSSKDRGRWWIANNQVCFKWFRWFDAVPRCATISLEGKHVTWRRDDGDTGTATIVEQGKPIEKPAVVVAEAKKPAAAPTHKSEHKASEVVIAANESVAEAPSVAEAKPSASHSPVSHSSVSQPEETVVKTAAPQPRNERVAAALHVPAPRLAVRPHHQDKIAVASVKPQFFTFTKVAATKVQPAKVAVARVETPKQETAKIEASKTLRKPFRVAGVEPSDVLNIRTGPSPEYQTVGGIAPNSRGITITGPCQNEWCPVKHRALVGWVNMHYLAEETAANTAAISEPNYWDPPR